MRLTFTMVIAPALLAACGGGQSGSSISPGSMPSGGSFSGVFHSPQYGEMHMQQQGAAVVGRYEKDERRGRIQGTARGDLLRFEWTEERELVGGRPTITRGRGYFQYRVGDDGRHNLLGRWGLDDDDNGGGEWNAYKLLNRRPDVDGTGGGMETTDDGVESWDEPEGGDDVGDGGDDMGDDSGEDDLEDDGLGGLDL
jgi:hypothetical protein